MPRSARSGSAAPHTCHWPGPENPVAPDSHSARGNQDKLGHFDAAIELVGDLFVRAENMGVILRESTDPCHPGQFSRLLKAIDRSKLGQAKWELAVAAGPGLYRS